MHDLTKPPPLPFRFLDLPAEIRNETYFMAFDCSEPVLMDPESIESGYIPRMPPLLRVCRQIREETRKIYYSNHTFYFARESRRYRATGIEDPGWMANAAKWLLSLEERDYLAIKDIQHANFIYTTRGAKKDVSDLAKRLEEGGRQLFDVGLKLVIGSRALAGSMECCARGFCGPAPTVVGTANPLVMVHLVAVGELADFMREERNTQGELPGRLIQLH